MTAASNEFGVNTYPYTQNMTAAKCIRHLSGLGFSTFELMIMPAHLWITDEAATLKSVRQAAADCNAEISNLNTANIDINIGAAAPEMRAYSIGMIKHFIRIGGELGAKAFILGPGKGNPLFPLPSLVMEAHFFAALDQLLPVAEQCGVSFWVENMPFAFLPDAESLRDCLDRYGEDRLRVCYDVANAHFIGEDPIAGLHRVAPRLELVHISDTGRTAYRHDPIGMGEIDFASLAGPISEACPHRRPMLEIISENPDAGLLRSRDALIEMGV